MNRQKQRREKEESFYFVPAGGERGDPINPRLLFVLSGGGGGGRGGEDDKSSSLVLTKVCLFRPAKGFCVHLRCESHGKNLDA